MASNFNVVLPEWDNPGTAPNGEVITDGWVAGDKPPAPWFNWQWNLTYESLKEIRDFIDSRDENLESVQLLQATLSSSQYTVETPTEGPVLSTPVEGTTFNILVSGDSLDNSTLKIHDDIARPLTINTGRRVVRGTLKNERIYTVTFSDANWRVINVNDRLQIPPVFVGNLNQVNYDGVFVCNNTTINVPYSGIDEDIFFVHTIRMLGGPEDFVLQRAQSLLTYQTYNRRLYDTISNITAWQESTGEDMINHVAGEGLIANGSSNGITVNYNTTAPFNMEFSPGYVYRNGKLIRFKNTTTLDVVATTGTYIVYINEQAQIIYQSNLSPAPGAQWFQYAIFSINSSLAISNFSYTLVDNSARGLYLDGDVKFPTLTNINDDSDSLATTSWVTRKVNLLEVQGEGIALATATRAGTVVSITTPDEEISIFRFVAPAAFVVGDTYTLNGNNFALQNNNGGAVLTGWAAGAVVIIAMNAARTIGYYGYNGINDSLNPTSATNNTLWSANKVKSLTVIPAGTAGVTTETNLIDWTILQLNGALALALEVQRGVQ